MKPIHRGMTALMLAGLWLGAGGARPATAQPVGAQPRATAADNDYYMATWLYNEKKWAMAVEEYSKFIKTYPSDSRVADAQFGKAQALFQLGKYKDSAEAFKVLLAKHQKFDKLAEAQFQLGQAYVGAGQLDLAATAFAAMAGKFKAHYLAEWAGAMRADCLVNLRQFDKAEVLLVPLVKKYVRDSKAAVQMTTRKRELAKVNPQLAASFGALILRADWNLALAQFGQKKFEEAAKGFASFVSRNPTSEMAEAARFHLAQSLYFSSQFVKAAAAYEAVVKGKGPLAASASFDRALAIYKTGAVKKAAEAFIQSAKNFPNTDRASRAHLYAGTCLYEAGEFAAAIVQFDAMIKGKDPVAVDEAKYWKGMAQLKLKRPGEAAKTLTNAIKAHPTSGRLADMKLAYADALLAENKFDEAAHAYVTVAASYPQHESAARALYTAAFARHRANQWVESAKLCAKFKADYPKDKLMPRVLFIAGENQFFLKKYPEAATGYRELLAKYAADKSPEIDRARLRLAWTSYFQKQFARALLPLEAITDKADDLVKREATYLKANCLLELKRDDEAAKTLNAYLAMAGEKPYADDALFKIALIYIRQNQRDKALAPLERLVKEHPSSVLRAQAEYELGEVCLQQKRYQEALSHYTEVVKRDAKGPLGPYAAFGKALCYYEQGKWKESANAFASVVANYPRQQKLLPQALYRQGLSFQKLEQWAVAESAFGMLVRRFPKDPYAPSALKAIGLGQEKQEKYDKAAATFAQLVKQYPDSKELDQAYYELAWCSQKLNNKEQMLQAYKLLAEKFPQSALVADAYYHLADQHYAKKEYPQAEALYQRCLAAAKDDRLKDKSLYRLGWCHWLQGKFAEAAEQFDRLSKDFANSDLLPDALLSAGAAYLRIGKPSEAADRLTRLVAGPAGKGFGHLAEAGLRLGEAQLALGQPDKALVSFKNVRAKFPEFESLPAVDFGIGRSLFELKKYDEAIRILTGALESPKVSGETAAKSQFYIGESHLAAGRPRDALKSYLRVTVLYTAFPEWVAASYYELGQAYLQLNEKAEAAKQFQAVVDKFPQSKWAESAKKQLERLKS